MRYISLNLKNIAAACAAAAIALAAVSAFGQADGHKDRSGTGHKEKQKSFCSSDNWSSDGKFSFREVRELTVPAGGTINVDGGRNGGISVTGEERSDILVRACVQTWGESDENARTIAGNTRIGTAGTIKAENTGDSKNWSVSYQILTPRASDLSLTANNGGISISSVNGTAEFETKNGGINLSGVSGNVQGRTTNGGINVRLSGTSWVGTGLDLETRNGRINISMTANYAAHIETATVNGGFKSNIPRLIAETDDGYAHRRGTRINTGLNGGGPPVRIVTTNGGIRINSSED